MKLHKISTLVGEEIMFKSENEAVVELVADGYKITMLEPKEPISIYFPKVYPDGETIMDELKGQEIEIECEIL